MNGKGDKPRNCFSEKFKSNYEEINWGKITCRTCGKIKKQNKFFKYNVNKTGICKKCKKS